MTPQYGYFRIGYSNLIESLLCPSDFTYKSNSVYTVRTKHGLDIATYLRPCPHSPTESVSKTYSELSFHEDIIEVLYPSTEDESIAQEKQKVESNFYLERSNGKIQQMNIPMTIVDVYSFFTGEKIIFSFISGEKKIDFRDLARELGQIFKMKIELHKIYHRDFSALLDGLGFCGRRFCCSGCKIHKKRNYSSESNSVGPVGICGKSRCCLNYES